MEAKPPDRCSKFIISTLGCLLLYTVLFLCGFGSPAWSSQERYGLHARVGLWKSCYEEKDEERVVTTTCLNTDQYLESDGLVHWVHGLYICVIVALLTLVAAFVVFIIFLFSTTFNNNLIGLWIPLCGIVTSAFLCGCSGVIFALRTAFEFDLRNMHIDWGCICVLTATPIGFITTALLFFEFHTRTRVVAERNYRRKMERKSILQQSPHIPMATSGADDHNRLSTNVNKAIHEHNVDELRSSHAGAKQPSELQPLKNNDYCENPLHREQHLYESAETPDVNDTRRRKSSDYSGNKGPKWAAAEGVDNRGYSKLYDNNVRTDEEEFEFKQRGADVTHLYDNKHQLRIDEQRPSTSSVIEENEQNPNDEFTEAVQRKAKVKSEERAKQSILFSRNMNVSVTLNDNNDAIQPTTVESAGVRIPSWAETQSSNISDPGKRPGGKLLLDPIATSGSANKKSMLDPIGNSDSANSEKRQKRHKPKRKHKDNSDVSPIVNSRDDALENTYETVSMATVSGKGGSKDRVDVSKGTISGVSLSKDSLKDMDKPETNTKSKTKNAENAEFKFENDENLNDDIESILNAGSNNYLKPKATTDLLMSPKLVDPIRAAVLTESGDSEKPQSMRKKYKEKKTKQRQSVDDGTMRKSRDDAPHSLYETTGELVMDALEAPVAANDIQTRPRSNTDSRVMAPEEKQKKSKVRRSSHDYSTDSPNKDESQFASTTSAISPTDLPPVRLSKRKQKHSREAPPAQQNTENNDNSPVKSTSYKDRPNSDKPRHSDKPPRSSTDPKLSTDKPPRPKGDDTRKSSNVNSATLSGPLERQSVDNVNDTPKRRRRKPNDHRSSKDRYLDGVVDTISLGDGGS